MRLAAAPLLLLGACGQPDAPANNVAAPAKAPEIEGDVGIAQRLVREKLGEAGARGISFSEPRRSRSEGVTIICGAFTQAGRAHRYIVVGGEDAFVEPQMGPGEMDRAFVEFCNQGAQNPAQPAPPPVLENAL